MSYPRLNSASARCAAQSAAGGVADAWTPAWRLSSGHLRRALLRYCGGGLARERCQFDARPHPPLAAPLVSPWRSGMASGYFDRGLGLRVSDPARVLPALPTAQRALAMPLGGTPLRCWWPAYAVALAAFWPRSRCSTGGGARAGAAAARPALPCCGSGAASSAPLRESLFWRCSGSVPRARTDRWRGRAPGGGRRGPSHAGVLLLLRWHGV